MTRAGAFITFEGGEGCGKSTQVKLLNAALRAAGIETVVTREPGGTPFAEKIREILVQRGGGERDPLSEVLLLSAARREHLVERIWPAMKNGAFVISDRFIDSTRAMQGRGMGVDAGVIEAVYNIIAGDFRPGLTFVFDLDSVMGLNRSTKRLHADSNNAATEDRYERMELAFHERLREGFLDIARREPDRCVVIDAAQAVEDVHARILAVVSGKFGVSLKAAA